METLAFLLLALLCSAATAADATDIKTDGHVLLLNDKNFHKAVQQNQYLFVDFYAPWCDMCRKFNPKFGKIAAKYADRGIPIVFAKVDAEKNKEAAVKYEVVGYPTLMVISGKDRFHYEGDYDEASIEKFLAKILMDPTPDLPSVADRVTGLDKVAVMVTEKREGKLFELYQIAAKMNLFMDFYTVAPTEETKLLLKGQEGQLFIFKRKGHEVIPFTGKPKKSEVLKFFADHRWDLIAYGEQLESIDRIYEPNSPPAMIGFFNNEQSPEFLAFKQFAQEIGLNKGLMFFVSYVGEEGNNLAEFMGIASDNRIGILKGNKNFDAKRYLMEDPITVENIRGFWSDYKAGRILRHYRSEPEPEDNSKPVKKIVSKTFKKFIPSRDTHLLLFVHDKDCAECERVSSVHPVRTCLPRARREVLPDRQGHLRDSRLDPQRHPRSQS